MKKITQIIILLFVFLSTSFSLRILAQESTPEADTDSTPSAQTDDDDIEKIRQAVKDKVKEKIDQIINKPNQKTGWVGKITEITNNQISLNCLNQDTRLTLIDEDTAIINSKRQQVDTDQLKIDQIILAMGYIDIEGQLLAKRVLITNEPIENLKNTIILATITDISQTTSTMTLITNDRQIFQIKTDKSTKDLTKNQKIIVVLKQDSDSSDSWQIVDFKLFTPLTTPTATQTNSE
jgi:hypothetical protein